MKNILFYILLFAFIYFIYTRLFLKSTLEQENFDPSLVPVSSIVTLAKVAQKLVNGNGTLTNPGNLQIGASTSAAGNLTVTGNERINGNSLIDGTLGVTGATTLSGATNVNNTLGVTSNTTVGGTLGVTGNTTLGGTLGVTGATTLTGATNVNNTLGVTGNTTVGGTLGVTGNTTFTGSTTTNGSLMANNNVFIGDKAMLYSKGDPFANDGWVRLMKADGSAAYSGGDGEGFAAKNLYSQQNIIIDGALQLRGVSNGSNGQINDKDGVSRLLFYNDDKNTYYDSGSGNVHHFRGYRGAGGTNVNVNGNVTATGNVTADGFINGGLKRWQSPSITSTLSGEKYTWTTTWRLPAYRSAYNIIAIKNGGKDGFIMNTLVSTQGSVESFQWATQLANNSTLPSYRLELINYTLVLTYTKIGTVQPVKSGVVTAYGTNLLQLTGNAVVDSIYRTLNDEIAKYNDLLSKYNTHINSNDIQPMIFIVQQIA